jgi:hypothetical protein
MIAPCHIHPGYEVPLPGTSITHLRQSRDMWAKYIAQAVCDGLEPDPRAIQAFKNHQTAIRNYEP